MGDERRVHEPRQPLRDVQLESLLLIGDVILDNRRLELHESNNGGSIMEVSDEHGNTLTTKLDLAVLSAAVDDVSVGTEHGDISSAVETFTRHERIGDERLLCLF